MNNKPKTKLLTISLLCCGRPETTERCLKSLMPIRQAIDSELQVVDTGCSPETRAVIEEYADEVFEFKWINDFAAARNFQLDQANGKMFLFIDDDEFFLDCKYIIEFFKDPKCTTYNVGGYYQRNYLDFEGKEYEDVEVIRMCSVTPETQFKGKVHEYIEPSYGNAMFMDAKAGHYGYVYTNDEDNFKHSMRNIPLLLEMMKEEPDNLRWPYQIAQEYRAIKYYNELYEVCHNGFYHSFEIDEPESIRYRGPFACGVAIAYEGLKKDDELLAWYADQMSKNEIMDLAKAKLSLYAAKVMFVRGMYDECEKAANFYFKMMDQYAKDRGLMFLQGGIFITDVFDELHTNMMYCYLMTVGMHKGDFGPLVHYYRKISWNSPVVRINRGFVTTLILKASEYGDKKELVPVLNKFFIRPGFRDILQNEIEENKLAITDEGWENLKKAFKKTDKAEEMLAYIDIRIMERAMASNTEIETFSEAYDIIAEYVNAIMDWKEIHDKWKEEGDTIVPSEVKIANGVMQFSQIKDTNPTKAVICIKNIIGIRKVLDQFLVTFLKLYGEYQKILALKKNDPAKFNEMYQLEEAVFNQIGELDAAGKTDEAVATYQQLQQILQQACGVTTLHF